MTDIAMCRNHGCPLSSGCYRHEATPSSYWQSYGNFQPDEDNNCEHYWPIKELECNSESYKIS